MRKAGPRRRQAHTDPMKRERPIDQQHPPGSSTPESRLRYGAAYF